MTTTELPIYQFLDDPEYDGDLSDVPHRPVPEITHVPNAERLLELGEHGMSFRNAFCIWASELLGRQQAHEDALGGFSFDELHAAALSCTTPQERNAGRAVALAPLFERQGLTLRTIAELVGLTDEEVVGAYFGNRAVVRADTWLDIEEELVEDRLNTVSINGLAKRYGLKGGRPQEQIRRLCVRHGIDPTKHSTRKAEPFASANGADEMEAA